MLNIGRLCIKTAGRDAGHIAVIVDVIDKNYVLVDGNVRRRKCNIQHIEPLPQSIAIEKNASLDIIKQHLAAINIVIKEKRVKVKEEDKEPEDQKNTTKGQKKTTNERKNASK